METLLWLCDPDLVSTVYKCKQYLCNNCLAKPEKNNSLFYSSSYSRHSFLAHVPSVGLSGVAVDSTVSEPEQKGPPTLSPTHTLGLLHLSGQGTLVQQSLSQ